MPASLGLLFATGSLAAGIFSSYIVTNTDLEVLVDPGSCRMLNYSNFMYGNGDTTFTAAVDSATKSFAQRCYTPGPLPSQCNFLIRPRIEPILSFIDCPFDPSLCHSNAKAAVLDSGYLDSNDVLGINAPPKDRVLVRRKSTCVPLDTARHMALLNNSDPIVTNITGGRFSSAFVKAIDWWALLFGTATGASSNISGLHASIPGPLIRQYEFKYVCL